MKTHDDLPLNQFAANSLDNPTLISDTMSGFGLPRAAPVNTSLMDKRRANTLQYAARITRAIVEASAHGASADSSTTLLRDGHEQHVVFQLGQSSYALPIANMLVIEFPLVTTPLPFVPVWHSGITDLRGDIISVIDLRLFLGLTPATQTRAARVIVARSLQDEIVVGLTVDAVQGIHRLDIARIAPPDAAEQPLASMRGMYDLNGLSLAVLNIEELLRTVVLKQGEIAAASVVA